MRQTTREATTMLYVDISMLSDGLHDIELRPTAEELELDPDMFTSVDTNVRLDIGDKHILCRIEIRAEAELICDRTLEPFVEPIAGSYTVVFTKDPNETSEGDDDIRLLDPTARTIDITEMVRDTVLLSVPLRKVAPSAREKELQLQFGAPAEDGDSVDPRWEALRKLKTGS
ncbi:MAG TPA: DUF177 domain-containing protein [Rhodothermia bacterium]|nr:DUF177 domain-containing protein [Rhodothermia bacterium]